MAKPLNYMHILSNFCNILPSSAHCCEYGWKYFVVASLIEIHPSNICCWFYDWYFGMNEVEPIDLLISNKIFNDKLHFCL